MKKMIMYATIFSIFIYFYVLNYFFNEYLWNTNSENKNKPYKKNNTVVSISKSHKFVCNITFVSAYFKLDSKHDVNEYKNWLSNFFSIEMCLVFFYDDISNVAQYKNASLIHRVFIHVNLDRVALNFFNKTTDWWNDQTLLDPEIHIHKSYKLYWIWGLKSYFLNKAVELNIFNSSAYFWIDAGCIRTSQYTHENWKFLPIPQTVLNQNKIFLVNLYPFKTEQFQLNANGYSDADFSKEDHIAGAIFGGQKLSIEIWKRAYLKTFNYYADAKRFAGKDQSVYASMCLENSDLCQFVVADPNLYNIWFGMIPFLLGIHQLQA